MIGLVGWYLRGFGYVPKFLEPYREEFYRRQKEGTVGFHKVEDEK